MNPLPAMREFRRAWQRVLPIRSGGSDLLMEYADAVAVYIAAMPLLRIEIMRNYRSAECQWHYPWLYRPC